MKSNNLPIVSSYDYFENLIKFVVNSDQKRELPIFVKFVNNYDITFKLYGVSYNINNLYKNYEHYIIKTYLEQKNYTLDFFQEQKIPIIRLYQKILTSESFELSRFFSAILMSAKPLNKEYNEEIQKIKLNIFNNKVVSNWIKQNNNRLHQEIINECA